MPSLVGSEMCIRDRHGTTLHVLLYPQCRGPSIALPVTKHYSLQRFVLLIWECPEERVSLVSGNYDIAWRSELDTNAAQFLDYSSRIVIISRGNLQIGTLIVELLHPRLTITPVLCFRCHHSTTTIAELRCSYRSVSLYNLGGNTNVSSAIRRSEKHCCKELTVLLLKLTTLLVVLRPLCLSSIFLFCCSAATTACSITALPSGYEPRGGFDPESTMSYPF